MNHASRSIAYARSLGFLHCSGNLIFALRWIKFSCVNGLAETATQNKRNVAAFRHRHIKGLSNGSLFFVHGLQTNQKRLSPQFLGSKTAIFFSNLHSFYKKIAHEESGMV